MKARMPITSPVPIEKGEGEPQANPLIEGNAGQNIGQFLRCDRDLLLKIALSE